MKSKFVKAITIGVCIILLTAITVWPPQTRALHTWPLRFHFGFPINNKFRCECSGGNHMYRAGRLGMPRPLPPSPTEGYPGPLVDLDFDFLPFLSTETAWLVLYPGVSAFLGAPEQRLYSPIREGEFVLGNTHRFIMPAICINFEFQFGIPPVTCDTKIGWLWRIVGSSRISNPLAIAEGTQENIEEIQEGAEEWQSFFSDLGF